MVEYLALHEDLLAIRESACELPSWVARICWWLEVLAIEYFSVKVLRHLREE